MWEEKKTRLRSRSQPTHLFDNFLAEKRLCSALQRVCSTCPVQAGPTDNVLQSYYGKLAPEGFSLPVVVTLPAWSSLLGTEDLLLHFTTAFWGHLQSWLCCRATVGAGGTGSRSHWWARTRSSASQRCRTPIPFHFAQRCPVWTHRTRATTGAPTLSLWLGWCFVAGCAAILPRQRILLTVLPNGPTKAARPLSLTNVLHF